MAAALEGKIAAILSESLVVINRGSDAGVCEGMVFVVLAEGSEVKDPETGKPLGAWEIPKGHVRATHVQPRLSTCAALSPEKEAGDAAASSTQTLSTAMIGDAMRRSLAEGTAARLNVRRSQIEGVPEIAPIQVGDRVRLITEKQ